MKIEELSSSLTPSTRNSVLLKFQTGKVDGIVCSDALARGIDIPNVDVVISYDAPRHVKTYIHRIGRTARAGRLGTAVTLLAPNELNAFQVKFAFHHVSNVNSFIDKLLKFYQAIIRDGGKQHVEEIKVTENAEEIKAKNYATALQQMQNALKREKQVQLIKQMNEKNKSNVSVTVIISSDKINSAIYNEWSFHLQSAKRSVIGQLQSQVQQNDISETNDEHNVPESWKWENLDKIKDRKERKNKNKNKKRNKKGKAIIESNE